MKFFPGAAMALFLFAPVISGCGESQAASPAPEIEFVTTERPVVTQSVCLARGHIAGDPNQRTIRVAVYNGPENSAERAAYEACITRTVGEPFSGSSEHLKR